MLSQEVEQFLVARMPEWKKEKPQAANLQVAVMGCVVNGPGESKAAHIGISLPGTGEAPKAAEFAGIKPSRLVLFCLGFSGILAGMAGLFEVSGPAGQITTDFNSGYGFTAIIVAFLGRLNPWGILAAGLLMALTYIGGELAQLMLGVPGASIQLFQGMLLFFLLATDLFINYRIRFGGGK